MSDSYDFSGFDEIKNQESYDFSGFDAESSPELTSEVSKPEEVSKVDSAIRGARQGATLGFSDEIDGAFQSGLDKVVDFFGGKSSSKVDKELKSQGFTGDLKTPEEIYQKYRDLSRVKDKKASEVNPKSYNAAEIGSGFLMPGGAVTKGVKVASKIKNAAKLGASGAAIGGAMGAGYNENPEDLVGDVTGGASFGGLVGPLAGPVAAKIKDTSKGAKNFLGDLQLIRDFKAHRANAKAGQSTVGQKAMQELEGKAYDKVQDTFSGIDKLGSALAKKKGQLIEDSDQLIETKDLVDIIKTNIDNIGAVGDETIDIQKINQFADDLITKYGDQLDLKSAEEIKKKLYDLSKSKDRLLTNTAKKATSDSEKSLRSAIQGSDESIKSVDSQITGLKRSLDGLGLEDLSKTFQTTKEAAKLDGVADRLVNTLDSTGIKRVSAEKRIDDLFDAVENASPGEGKNLKELTDTIEKFNLSRSTVKDSGTNFSRSGIINAISNRGADVLGKTERYFGKRLPGKVAQKSQELISKSSDELKTIAAKIRSNPLGEKTANQLEKLAETTNRKRKQALIFALMQERGSRHLLGRVEDDVVFSEDEVDTIEGEK